jgi:hypothetical protein
VGLRKLRWGNYCWEERPPVTEPKKGSMSYFDVTAEGEDRLGITESTPNEDSVYEAWREERNAEENDDDGK